MSDHGKHAQIQLQSIEARHWSKTAKQCIEIMSEAATYAKGGYAQEYSQCYNKSAGLMKLGQLRRFCVQLSLISRLSLLLCVSTPPMWNVDF